MTEYTNSKEQGISVGVYLRGDNLDPDDITRILGTSPTKKQKKGDALMSPSGQEVRKKIGVWAVVSNAKSSSVVDHLNQIIRHFDSAKSVFTSEAFQWTNLPGIDEAYLDVFVCEESVKSNPTIEFELPPRVMIDIAEFGLLVRFTISSTHP